MKQLIMVALIAATTLFGCTMANAQTTLKIATVIPDGTAWMASMRTGTAEIEERTEGRVKFKIYAGGVQGNDAQVRRKMRVGQLHGGVFTSGGLRAFQKDAEIYSLPMLFRDYDEVRYVRERVDDEVYQRLEASGYVTFGYAGGGFAYLVSNAPVAQQSDMSKLKFWIPEGDDVAKMATSTLGINPVSLPLTDVLTGLQTELIDTVMGPPVGVIVMQWHTAMSHITDLPLAYVYAGLLIDKKAFGKISVADQTVVREVMSKIYRHFDKQGEADDKQAFKALIAEGITPVAVSPEESAGWEALFRQANIDAGKAGAYDPAMMTLIKCHLEAYRGQNEASTCTL
jgi:TRAP-type C4-dicarboxylate transport system substrate-binding protein